MLQTCAVAPPGEIEGHVIGDNGAGPGCHDLDACILVTGQMDNVAG